MTMAIKDMLGRSGVVSREDALKVLNEHLVVSAPATEEVEISRALGICEHNWERTRAA